MLSVDREDVKKSITCEPEGVVVCNTCALYGNGLLAEQDAKCDTKTGRAIP